MKDINFLKKQDLKGGLAKKKESKSLIRNLLIISVVGVVAIYLGCVSYDLYLNVRSKSLSKEIKEYAEVEALQKKAKEYKNDINTIKKIIDKSNSYGRMKSDTLKIIGDKCPNEVSVINFSVDTNNNITLSGKGTTNEKVLEFAENLRISGYFKNVSLTSITLGKTNINGKTDESSAYYNYAIKISN